MEYGLDVKLYESKTTVSKYILLIKDDIKFKVRFSNHKANKIKEEQEDCDFYVGVNHGETTTTDDALKAVKSKFFIKDRWSLINFIRNDILEILPYSFKRSNKNGYKKTRNRK